jgi:GT2 family glycosyltransferase
MNDAPRMSVVLSCFADERLEAAIECVEAVRAQSLAPLEIIVVVDHNPELLGRLRRAAPDVRTIESRGSRGSSAARNTGVAAAGGDVVVFFDDDAVPQRDCLERLAAHYVDEHVIGVGGSLSPAWSTRRPRWLPEEFDWVVGCTYRGLPAEPAPIRNLIGANMSFRREALLAVGGFADEMARTGLHPLGVDDTEICIRLGARFPGSLLVYAPEASVRHKVPAGRTTWRYFCTRCLAEGRAKAALARIAGAAAGLSAERSYAARVLPAGVARGVVDVVAKRDLFGIARSLAILAGLAITSCGFVLGTLRPAKLGAAA